LITSFEELGIQTKPGKVRYSTICPKCNDLRSHHKNQSCLTVNDEPGNRWWHCNHPHCGWSGNLDVYDKYVKVLEKSNMPSQIPNVYSREVMDYWKVRGIDYRIALKERIFEFNLNGKTIIGFPFYMNNTLVNVKYLNFKWKKGDKEPKWWQLNKEYGTKIIPWGMQSLQFAPEEQKVIIWTEGELDRLTWMTAGYRNVLSEPQGAPNVNSNDFKEKFAYVNDVYFKSVIKDIDLIIFSTDGDEPGIKLREHLSLYFGKDRCKYINYPVGYKDINEVYAGCSEKNLAPLGKEGIDECYRGKVSFPVKGIITPSQIKSELETYVKSGFTPGLGIGISEIDNLFTLKPKHLTGITGLPSSGKSSFIRWYLCEFIKHNQDKNIKWAMFTPENRPVSREIAKIAEVFTGKSIKENSYDSMDLFKREKVFKFIEQHFFIISPDRMNFETWNNKIDANRINSMESLLQYLIYLKKTENIFGYVIDAWNKIENEQPKYISETQYISKQLDYLLDFGTVYDVHGIIIAHTTKIEHKGANYRIPCLFDIKGSSAWKEKIDIGIILHRYFNKLKDKSNLSEEDDEDDMYYIDDKAPTILKVEKIRFEETGKMGKTKLSMDSKGRFSIFDEKKSKESVKIPKLNPKIVLEDDKDDEDDIFSNKSEKLPF